MEPPPAPLGAPGPEDGSEAPNDPEGDAPSEAPIDAPGDVLVTPWWVGLDTLAAVAAFVLLYRYWGGLAAAIVAITVVSVLSGFLRVRHGVGVGRLLPLVTICVVARGVVGIITDSDDIYFAIGIGYRFAIAAGLVVVSGLESNPASEHLSRALGLPADVRSHSRYRSAVGRITAAFGVLLGLAAGFDIWFLGVTDPDEYVLFRYLINWPVYVAFTAASLVFLSRRLAEVPGFPGMLNLLEAQAEQRAAARKRSGH